ncbi:MAG: DUF2752 domain-containing protein [Alistipes sp.]|nr:DUF2752 domain-containing protein [Alistipes sp.]
MKREDVRRLGFKKFAKPAIVVVTVVAIVVVYRCINPVGTTAGEYMPKCFMKGLTGYDCPSCGSQRALHAILNGEFKRAILFNPFIFLALPYLLSLLYTALSRDRFARRIKPFVRHRIAIWSFLALYIAWWVIRNSEWWLGVLI